MAITDRMHPTARSLLREAHHTVFDLRGRFSTPVYRTQIRDVPAAYYVGNWKERWRAADWMGEREMLETLVDHIEPGAVVWDVGAAVGTYSVVAANAGAQVVAFEPVASNYQRLRENAGLNDVGDRITHHGVALSDATGTATFHLSGDEIGEGTHRINADGKTSVATMRGDAVDPAPDIIKIDVEGHEAAVLDGLGDHLDGARTVLVEVHDQHGVDPASVRDTLTDAGFTIANLAMGRSEEYLVGVDADAGAEG